MKARRSRSRVETPVKPQAVPPTVTPAFSPSHKGEAHILGLLIHRPDLLYRLDRGLLEAGLGRMTPEDFGYTDHQVLFRLVRQSLEQDADDTSDYLRQNLPSSLESLADELAVKPGELDPLDDRLIEDLFRAVVKIRRTALNENINELRFLQEESQQTSFNLYLS